MRCKHSPVDRHTPGCWAPCPGVVPVVSAPSEMRCTQTPDGWWGGEGTGAVAAGEFPKVPQRVFTFSDKSSCSILWLPPYKEGPDFSHSPPLQLCGGCPGQGCTEPNFQLFSASACGLPGVSTSSLFPFLRLQATGSLTVLLRPCCRGGAVNQTLSQESSGRPCIGRPGAAVALVPALVPGTFMS